MPTAPSPEPAHGERVETAERGGHVLVIRRRYLGDIVLLGSFLRNLRLHWPGARLTVLVESVHAPVLKLHPDVDATLTFPRGLGGWLDLARALRCGGFTHVFDVDNTDKTALLARFSGAPFRATLHLEGVRRHWPSFYTHTAFVSSAAYLAQPITDTYLSLLPLAGVPIVTREIRLVPRESDLAAARTLAGTANPPPAPRRFRVLVHPGSRSAFRLWPVENYAAVCDRLQDEAGAQVFVIAGPSEQARVAAIRQHAQTHLVTINAPLSVTQFAAFAAQFDVMLCHDSGPMHLAAAVGTAVVALFGSQHATVWRPVGENHVVLQPPLPCTTCVSPGLCVPGDSYRNHCVRNLTIEQVTAAVRSRLAGPRRREETRP
ncbi:MAG: glycosyltransferase family 9 protein [Opitutaceae bacterium]|nr:glycosyltransferase family 9 protein [Opitutaceae bacterium]